MGSNNKLQRICVEGQPAEESSAERKRRFRAATCAMVDHGEDEAPRYLFEIGTRKRILSMTQSVQSVELVEIHGFGSPSEYERFSRWLDAVITSGACIEKSRGLVVDELKHGRREIQFQNGETWRLDPPDFPFRGSWQAISTSA